VITNYGELKTAIADTLLRDDLGAVIPQFVGLAQAGLNRDVRHFRMENRATATLSGRYLEAPDDWVETIRFYAGSGQSLNRLELLSIGAMLDKRAAANDAVGDPIYYAHIENGFEVYPSPDGPVTVELLYLQKLPALVNDEDTNWVLTDHPDVYLYGSLLHTAPYLVEDERLNTWAQLYGASLARLNQSGEDQKWSGNSLQMKIRGLG